MQLTLAPPDDTVPILEAFARQVGMTVQAAWRVLNPKFNGVSQIDTPIMRGYRGMDPRGCLEITATYYTDTFLECDVVEPCKVIVLYGRVNLTYRDGEVGSLSLDNGAVGAIEAPHQVVMHVAAETRLMIQNHPTAVELKRMLRERSSGRRPA